MTKISVVILNWNGKKYLEDFLGSTVENSASDCCSVYLADNGSTDDSVDYVRDYHTKVNIIELDNNYGFAGGYNKALERIESEYYVLLNSDVRVEKNWLDPLAEYMDKNPDVAACQPKILSLNNPDKFEYAGASGGFIDRYGYPYCRGRVFNIAENDYGQYDDIKQVFWATGACLFIRSSDWKSAGGFDPVFFTHMEEIDLCWRLNNAGRKIMVIPQSYVYHLGGGTLSYNSPSKVYYNFRNNLFMLYKNLPESKLAKIMFIRKIMDGIAALHFLLMFKTKAFLNVFKAHIHFYRHKKTLRMKRSLIPEKENTYASGLVLDKSLVFNFYIKGKKTFIQLHAR